MRLTPPLKSTLTKESVSYPKRITVSNIETEKRSVYMPDSSRATELTAQVKEILRNALVSDNVTVAEDSAQWENALQSKSIYVEYPVAFDTAIFASILELELSPTPAAKLVREFIISGADTVSSAVTVYVRDAGTGQVYVAPVRYDKQQLISMIDTYATDSIGDHRFSVELKFNDAGGGINDGQVQQSVVLSPNVLLALREQPYPMVKETNLLFDHEYKEELVQNILIAFGFNTSGIRRYVESDNSLVYVENYGTIKLHENGWMEYRALDAEKGFALSAESGATQYDSFISAIDFVNSLWEEAVPGIPLNLNLSSNVTDEKNKAFSVYLDYSAGGAKISDPVSHAIEIQIVNNRIVSYKQKFAYFETTDEMARYSTAIDAINLLLSQQRPDVTQINDIFMVYDFSGSTLWRPTWAARTGSGEEFVIGH
ncbi:MAG: hypothetical protein E7409_02275 [Ruminococcaceae bacterium]|nr:hypothetical protein [Oscillospiraceae bacterium]